MKKIIVLTLAVGLIVTSTGCGPGYRMQQGAIIGAALGAWAGQEMGHDSESTLIGAAAGGVAGAVIGDAVEQYETENSYTYPYSRPNAQNAQRVPPPRQ